MNLQTEIIFFGNKFIAENMVNMTMGIQKFDGFEIIFLNEGNQSVSFFVIIAAGVNNKALTCFIRKDVSVFLKRAERKKINF